MIVKGADVQAGDLFNGKQITYRQRCSNCIAVTFSDGSSDYFVFAADVVIERPMVIEGTKGGVTGKHPNRGRQRLT
jgi:hypothetical protein